jgi:hypothetical protein
MLLTSLITTVASEAASEPAVNPWFIGIGVFALLAALMVALLMFGAGRDHS